MGGYIHNLYLRWRVSRFAALSISSVANLIRFNDENRCDINISSYSLSIHHSN